MDQEWTNAYAPRAHGAYHDRNAFLNYLQWPGFDSQVPGLLLKCQWMVYDWAGLVSHLRCLIYVYINIFIQPWTYIMLEADLHFY
jgi:hypothetical protein